ncbi:hypothetical protein ABZ260_49625 [Streptosporangium sp. NPDC006013]|uniref:hypothetical protein n=1 Tax=Streptosporangium sp. NPDC006013 TaxID=3155596 RepID=UPI0033BE8976
MTPSPHCCAPPLLTPTGSGCCFATRGAYTGAFRTGDIVHLSGKLVHTQDAHRSGFGIELTPWSVTESYPATLTG